MLFYFGAKPFYRYVVFSVRFLSRTFEKEQKLCAVGTSNFLQAKRITLRGGFLPI